MIMRKLLFIIIPLLGIYCQSQITVGPPEGANPVFFLKKDIKDFKKTTTIFVFSNAFEKHIYEDILEKSWTVTPYKIIDYKNFNIRNYLGNEFSFALLNNSLGYYFDNTNGAGAVAAAGGGLIGGLILGTAMGIATSATKSNSRYIDFYFEVFMLNNKKIEKKFKKFEPELNSEDIFEIINSNKKPIAKINLYQKAEFQQFYNENDISFLNINREIYETNYFHNYQPGLLVNYLQQVNSLLIREKVFELSSKFYTKDINLLKKQPLYVPTYEDDTKEPWESEIPLAKYISNYKFEYKYIDNSTLNQTILDGEEIYYIRYFQLLSSKFIQIINSKNGDIIYSSYYEWNNDGITSKQLKKLSELIGKE